MMKRFLQLLSGLFLASAYMTGCNTSPATDYSKVELIDVSGKVTLDGNPVPYAVVTFESVDTGSFSGGMADESGRYRLRFDTAKLGVTPGRKLVQIGTARKILGISTDSESGDAVAEENGDVEPDDEARLQASRIEAIPDCYHKESKLYVEVTNNSSVFDFHLKSDCTTSSAD